MSSTASGEYDIHVSDGVETRFGIRMLSYDEHASEVVMTMPMAAMHDPFRGSPTLAPLALLVDDIGSTVNFSRRQGRWPVTSELALTLCPDASDVFERASVKEVRAQGYPSGGGKADVLAGSTVLVGETPIAAAVVRSVLVGGDAVAADRPAETLTRSADTSLAELLAVSVLAAEDGNSVLKQHSDPMIWNATETVHGGIAATALELVAHAAILTARPDVAYRTGSLRVNFLRPLVPGPGCRYVGTAVRVGTTTAIADAWAEGDDGKEAVVARLTAYAEGDR
ncbi:PaaI family thioesterase [Mycobacterium sp. pW049]|uniref:PaaI family thioesterase n=1 Tax=[Mycobacterium] bulgaricum TaxID=3238985 RepID=UPI00351AF850